MQDSNLTCPLSETLGYEPNEFVLYSNLRYMWLRGLESNQPSGAYETPVCTSSAFPQYLYKRQDLHLHGLVTYQPTSDEVMSIYRLSSRFERFHHSCIFFNLQHVKELFSVPVLETFPYCIKIYGLVSVSQYKFLWRRGESNPRLAQAV